jgi:hypothetical protein
MRATKNLSREQRHDFDPDFNETHGAIETAWHNNTQSSVDWIHQTATEGTIQLLSKS